MKKIDTLVEDIYSTIQGEGNWNAAVTRHFSSKLAMLSCQRFVKPQEPRSYLSLSSVGTPCKRKLWYKINLVGKGEPLEAYTLLKFFYGDMIEELMLCLTAASGHKVEGMQDRLDVHGVKGHRDAIIDGMTIDVK